MSLADNGLLTAHRENMVRGGWIKTAAVKLFAERCIKAFDVRCGGSGALAQSLSGGNLQKFIVGREILQEPKVLVVAQPTWGVDVGAAGFIRQQLLDLSARGVAILVISEELEELFDICDRLAVIARGKLSPVRKTSETNAEEVGLFMAGLFEGKTAPAAEPDSLLKH
jgi:simple sugar transport system ATP-binding protein